MFLVTGIRLLIHLYICDIKVTDKNEVNMNYELCDTLVWLELNTKYKLKNSIKQWPKA